MNGSTCCAEKDAGLAITGAKLPGLPGTTGGVNTSPAPGGNPLDKIAAALDAAIHGTGATGNRNAGNAGGTGNVIDFPMVSAYKPIIKTRSVVAGLNARFPNVVNFTQRVGGAPYTDARRVVFNERGERDADADGMPEGATSLGFLDPASSIPSGIGLSSSGGGSSNLALILGAINQGLATVPAILSARKRQPYYDPNSGGQYQYGTEGGGYPGGAGADIGARTGAAVGNVGDTFGQIVAQHPYLILAGGAALFLLFMNPPRRR